MMIQTPLLQELQNMSISFLRITVTAQAPSCGLDGAFPDMVLCGVLLPLMTSYAFDPLGVNASESPKGGFI